MNEQLVELKLEGLAGLRQMLAGKHLRPAQLALTIVTLVAAPEEAEAVLLDVGKQARWEVAHGEAT